MVLLKKMEIVWVSNIEDIESSIRVTSKTKNQLQVYQKDPGIEKVKKIPPGVVNNQTLVSDSILQWVPN